MKQFQRAIIFIFMFCAMSVCAAQSRESWSAWVQTFRVEAIKEGIKPSVFDEVFSTMSGPNEQVLKYYHGQPERRLSFLEYRQTRANNARIQMGRREYQKNKTLLDGISKTYGVDSCFILALWGLETDYGHFMGHFSVPWSLATLAYASDRQAFFRHELLGALRIIQEGQVSLEDFKGEWAGASGHPQFLPSSWYKYAVDYDHNGRKDIWKNLPDALASIANYLAKNGWEWHQPWAVEVTLPADFDTALIGKTVVKSVSEWRHLGVHVSTAVSPQLSASIVSLNGGPALMVFHNFRVLQTWNDSNYYIATVGYLADRICE
jgi:peptidoglycan lytic transglycosylase B